MELFLPIFLSLVALVKSQSNLNGLSFEYFDDYLLTVAAPSEHNEVLHEHNNNHHNAGVVQDPDFGDTTTDSVMTTTAGEPENLSYADILGYFRDVPREHWSCCMLGMLAGNKGFHCNAAFYAARIASRNTNRAHTRVMPFHGRHSNPHWGRQIMHTFSRCVVNHTDDFHQCCYAATVERRERVRWQLYRSEEV